MIPILVLIAFILLLADSEAPLSVPAGSGSGTVWMLEQNEPTGSAVNMMTCGDYSGCTITREVPEPGELTATGDRFRPVPGIVPAVITIGPSVGARTPPP